MADIIASIIIAALVGAAIAYIVRAKRRGAKCIGCPTGESACASGACACSGACATHGGFGGCTAAADFEAGISEETAAANKQAADGEGSVRA